MKNKTLILAIASTLISCTQIDCEKLKQPARERECLVIVEKFLPYQEYSLNVKGRNLINNEDCICKDEGRWWNQYRDLIELGDTIIKRNGELTFNIHKKDTILSFQWECEGKKYY